MADVEELERRIAALEEQAKAGEDIRRRVAALERWKGDSYTALGKLLPILEETRLRVSAVEVAIEGLTGDVAQVRTDVRQIKAEQAALRRDLPALIGDALREFFKEAREREG